MQAMNSSRTTQGQGRRVPVLFVAALACTLAFAVVTPTLAAERIEPGTVQLSGWYGYQWGGSFDSIEGNIKLDSAPAFGVQAGLRVQDDGFAFVSFSRQSTTATYRFTDLSPSTRFDLDVGYIQIGGELDIPMYTHFVPFIGLSLGATYLSPQEAGASMSWFFSGSALGGFKFPITKNIGIKTQMRFLGTLVGGNTSFFCGSNGGATCAINIGDATGIIQGDVTGGLYISF